MKIIDVIIIPSYSCNVCHKTFRVKEELDLNFLVICSKKCEFKFIYNLVKKMGYSVEDYKKLLNIIGKEQQNSNYNQNIAIYEITKYYHKIGLSTITSLKPRAKPLSQEPKSATKSQEPNKTPPIYRGVGSGVGSNFDEVPFNQLALTFVNQIKTIAEEKNQLLSKGRLL